MIHSSVFSKFKFKTGFKRKTVNNETTKMTDDVAAQMSNIKFISSPPFKLEHIKMEASLKKASPPKTLTPNPHKFLHLEKSYSNDMLLERILKSHQLKKFTKIPKTKQLNIKKLSRTQKVKPTYIKIVKKSKFHSLNNSKSSIPKLKENRSNKNERTPKRFFSNQRINHDLSGIRRGFRSTNHSASLSNIFARLKNIPGEEKESLFDNFNESAEISKKINEKFDALFNDYNKKRNIEPFEKSNSFKDIFEQKTQKQDRFTRETILNSVCKELDLITKLNSTLVYEQRKFFIERAKNLKAKYEFKPKINNQI